MAGRLLVVAGQPGGRKQVRPVPTVHDAPTTMITYSMHQTFVKYRPRTPISISFIESGPSVQESLGLNVKKNYLNTDTFGQKPSFSIFPIQRKKDKNAS